MIKIANVHNIGCLGKIITFKETDDGSYMIELKGLIRFKIIKEIKLQKNIENMRSILKL